ncbi:ABC transporter substrate-binding protein [Clostridium sp. OS1-26]|uniref:ABC transporter substrate-binding protein n=1 Tax=Clostridium sp. OS1-26 TaxID=3070681 RepID=UPI0027E1D21B|nr:ABC transporter substrate-binding protein [Clostridium sp. OS1-26]WML37448.1 ABC transporter substrate-binding protein [Clostridium sp. OS1-26]
MTKRICLAIISIIILVSSLTGCSNKSIKIGYAGGLTGRNSELGVNGMYGATLAVEEINESGGINGRKLELVSKDDKNDKNTALQVDKDLVKEGCTAIIGHMTSSMSELTVPYINESKILMISPTIAVDGLSNKDDYFIRMIPENKQQADSIAKTMINKNISKVAILYEEDNRAFTESWKNDFEAMYEKLNGRVSYAAQFSINKQDQFSYFIREIVSSGAQGILILGSADEVALWCQKIKKEDVKLQIFIPTWAMTNDLLEQGGQTVEGAYGVNFVDYNSNSEDYLRFKKRYVDKFGSQPTFSSIFSYEAIKVLADAIKNSPNLKSDTLKSGIIKKSRYKGIQGEIYINAYGDAERTNYIYHIINGKFTKVVEK